MGQTSYFDETKLAQLALDLKLGSNDGGYTVKILEDSTNGNNVSYRAWDGSAWQASDAVYSSFRLSNIGLDFGIGSDRLQVKNSSLLLDALEDEPDKVQALFDQASTTTYDATLKVSILRRSFSSGRQFHHLVSVRRLGKWL